jgi:hypothetical protein
LRSWVEDRRKLRPDLNQHQDADEWLVKASEPQRLDMIELSQQIFSNRFPDTGWVYDPAMVQIHVTRSARGGGYTVWHVQSTGDTYLSAGYW